jgi:hypothetical protein
MLIEVGKPVAAPAVIVFATVADIMDWPQILSAVQSVEALDGGPSRAGSKLRVTRMMIGHLTAEDIEVIEIESRAGCGSPAKRAASTTSATT